MQQKPKMMGMMGSLLAQLFSGLKYDDTEGVTGLMPNRIIRRPYPPNRNKYILSGPRMNVTNGTPVKNPEQAKQIAYMHRQWHIKKFGSEPT